MQLGPSTLLLMASSGPLGVCNQEITYKYQWQIDKDKEEEDINGISPRMRKLLETGLEEDQNGITILTESQGRT